MKHFTGSKFSKVVILVLCVYLVSSDISDYPSKLDWWQTSIIYQLYPRSFKDSNDDGIGDLRGIQDQLSYFHDVGINSIWLSPIYTSPMYDMGYDVANFTEIDPLFGTMADFDSLVEKVKELDMKIIMDFVPNHSSDECKWFQESIKRIDPYTDYYIWRDPKGWTNIGTTRVPIPPNNWVSVFQGSAWEYNAEREQFYLHQFGVKQPDLNYRSPQLVEEMKDILRFWLDKGVDGFRIDSIMYLFENSSFPDEPIITNRTVNGYPEYYTAVNHTYTINLPETYSMAAEFRKLFDSYSQRDGQTRLMVTEAYTTLDKTLRYYGTSNAPIGHFPFNFFLFPLNYTSNAEAFKNVIYEWLDNMPASAWPNWVLGNHDNHRVPTRFSRELVDGMNMLNLLLPGTPITYQGEEIGMEDTKVRWDQTQDLPAVSVGSSLYESYSRDPERTPFQWNGSYHAGFSKTKGKTWLPVNPNYYELNVENQKRDPTSHLNVYKALAKLRDNEVIQKGELEITHASEWVLIFRRSLSGQDIFVIILNLNNEEEFVNLNASMSNLPPTMNVVVPSGNSEHNRGDSLSTGETGFKMRPYSSLVLQAPAKGDSLTPPSSFTSAGSRPYNSTELFVLVLCQIFIFKCLLG